MKKADKHWLCRHEGSTCFVKKLLEYQKNWNNFFIFLLLSFCLYYMEQGYFNTIIAKSYAYKVTLTFYLIPSLILLGCLIPLRPQGPAIQPDDLQPSENASVFPWKHRLHPTDIAVFLFSVSCVLATIFCTSPAASFTGDRGWQVGLWSLLGSAAVYGLFRLAPVEEDFLIKTIGIMTLPLFLWAIANGLGADPFDLHQKLLPEQRYNYIACIGNINAFSGYLSLMLPPICAAFLSYKKTSRRIFFGTSAFLGTMALFYNNSDGGFLGVAAGLAFLVGFALHRKLYLRLLSLLLLLSLAGSLSQLLAVIVPSAIPVRRGVPAFLLTWHIPPVALLVCTLLILLSRYFMRHKKELHNLPFLLYLLLCAGAVLFCLVRVIMHYSPAFGNNRGYIWGYALSIFRKVSLPGKLFGIGLERFGVYTDRYFSEEIQRIWGSAVNNAHNEYLQYLVTTGIFGFLGYTGMLLGTLCRYFCKKKTDPSASLFFYGIIGYYAQALVNNPHNLLVPLLFLFLAMAESKRPSQFRAEL